VGLAERRAAKEFETKRFPQYKADIEKAAGFAIPVDVAWDQLAKEGESHLYDECWGKVYFQPLITALQSITRDDMGKDALKAGLKKIRIQNTKGNYYGDGMPELADGILTLEHEPHSNVDNIDERATSITKALEKGL
jgi:hypothetical protein